MVNIYNWNDYIAPNVLEDFTRDTGIKVIYDTFDSQEALESKLMAGRSGYDIIMPSGPSLFRLGQARLLHPIEKSRLIQAGNIWPDVARRLQALDPGNAFGVTYAWGTIGIGINTRKVKERLGALALDAKAQDSWDIAFKPELAAKLKDCGIEFLDAPEDMLPAVLNWLGLPGNSLKEADLRRASDALARIRGNLRKFHRPGDVNALANGEACLVVASSSDVMLAKKRAEEARNGVEIDYIIPGQGAPMWFDAMAIPADAVNKAEAHAFIDYMLRADVAARSGTFLSAATGSISARERMKPAMSGNPAIYPDEARFARLFAGPGLDDKARVMLARLWLRVKTGR